MSALLSNLDDTCIATDVTLFDVTQAAAGASVPCRVCAAVQLNRRHSSNNRAVAENLDPVGYRLQCSPIVVNSSNNHNSAVESCSVFVDPVSWAGAICRSLTSFEPLEVLARCA